MLTLPRPTSSTRPTRPTRPTRLSGRRLAAVGAGLLLALPLVGVPAAPSSAAPIDNGILFVDVAGREFAGGNDCRVTDSANLTRTVDLRSGRGYSRSSRETGSLVSRTDDSDVTNTAAQVRTRFTSAAVDGMVRSMRLSGTLAATVVPSKGARSDCDVIAEATSRASLDLPITRNGFITIGARLPTPVGQAQVTVRGQRSAVTTSTNVEGNGGFSSTRFFVNPDTYDVGLTLRVSNRTRRPDQTNYSSRVTGSPSVTYTYAPAGSAAGPVTGRTPRLMAFGPTVSCSTRTLRLTWRKPAATVPQASVRLNGRFVERIRDPRPGSTVVVRNLPRTGFNTVRVATERGVVATRRYEPCGI